MTMKYEAELYDKITGQTAVYEDDWNYDTESLEFMWLRGNYSCDCNRSLFLSQLITGYIETEICGDERIQLKRLTALHDNGVRETIYPAENG